MNRKLPQAIEIGGRFSDWQMDGLREFAVSADEAGIDLLVLPDTIAPVEGGDGWPDALITIGWLAGLTKRVRLAGRVSTLGHQPYNLARRLASLDLISRGRAGWIVSSDQADAAYAAFSGPCRLDGIDPDEREREFVEVVRRLWNSWDGDALILDKQAAQFFRPEGMHTIDHEGRHFSVRGPLNVMRSKRGAPDLHESAKGMQIIPVETLDAATALLGGAE